MADTSITGIQSFNPLYGDAIPDAQPIPSSPTIPAAPDITNVQPQAPAAPAQTGVWQRVLMGALVGLAGGAGAKNFGQGVAGGAGASLAYTQQQKENAQRQQQLDTQKQEATSRIKFQDAQSANLVVEAKIKDLQLHNLPEQLQDAHNQMSLSFMNELQQMGIMPVLQAPNTGGDATDALAQLTKSHGAVPPLFTVNLGHQIVAYDLSQLSQTPQGLALINQVRAVQGQDGLSEVMWRQMPAGTRAQLANNAMEFYNPAAPKTAADAASVYQQYKNYLETYSKRPDADPSQVQRLKNIVNNMQKTQQGLDAHEVNQTKAKASAEASARLPFDIYKTKLEEAVRDGDPNSAGQMLVQGLVAPSQLISTRKPAFASQAFSAAQKLDPKWNAQKAEAQYKYASNPQTQNTLNMIDAMQEKGGSIDIAQAAFKDIPLKIADQDFNKIVNGTLTKFGGKSIIKFRTAMLGLADEYSKVMGGGQSSDTGRQQALDIIKEAYSSGQGAAAVDTMKADIVARKRAIVRDNPVLMRMYPDTTASASGDKPFDPATEFIPIPNQ